MAARPWTRAAAAAKRRSGPAERELTIGDDLKGDLKSTTTLNHFNVIITAETDSQTKTPSGEVALTATVQE